mgnify:CR=1 FL=1
MKLCTALAGIALVSASFACGADELIVTSNASKAQDAQAYAVDFVTSGNAVALQFNIKLPKGVDARQVDLKSCMADLPKTHTGQCNVAKGHIVGVAYNDTNVPFAAGIVPIGKLYIQSRGKGNRVGSLRVSEFLVSDKNANAIESVAKIAE